jgi:putative ABC transport system permease protein
MIRFLIKGLLRDRSRSLFPVIVVATGVTLTVLLQAWLGGVMGDMIRSNANFSTGHVKITTQAYLENEEQNPNDLALLKVGDLVTTLNELYPDLQFVERIKFGGLLDIPDEAGETLEQSPVAGWAVDLFNPSAGEISRMNIDDALVRGRLPKSPGEILVSDELAGKLKIDPGSSATILSSTMYGGMAMSNFTIAGTVRFGVGPMDRGTIIADISDARRLLDMEDAAAEILGYFRDEQYPDPEAVSISEDFNKRMNDPEDEFAPVMRALRDQNDLAEYLDLTNGMSAILSGIFILAMSIVLWNLGLIGGLRRYGEIGVRLAIGEKKNHVYWSMILESIAIGLAGSVVGTAIGLGLAWYMQIYGLDVGAFMNNSTMMISSVMRARITSQTFYIGFIPGLLSTVFGTAISGIGIYQRQTAQLFKELET